MLILTTLPSTRWPRLAETPAAVCAPLAVAQHRREYARIRPLRTGLLGKRRACRKSEPAFFPELWLAFLSCFCFWFFFRILVAVRSVVVKIPENLRRLAKVMKPAQARKSSTSLRRLRQDALEQLSRLQSAAQVR